MRERIEQEKEFKNEVEASRSLFKAQIAEEKQNERDMLLAEQDKVTCLTGLNLF